LFFDVTPAVKIHEKTRGFLFSESGRPRFFVHYFNTHVQKRYT